MSAEGTPSETPGHKVLTEDQKQAVTDLRRLGAEAQILLAALALCKGMDVDPRWLAIARTNLQEGLMAAVRAVTKPDFF
jgi:hypothetical protein